MPPGLNVPARPAILTLSRPDSEPAMPRPFARPRLVALEDRITPVNFRITDVRLVIEHFSKAHDPMDVAIGRVEQPSVSSSSDPLMRKSTD